MGRKIAEQEGQHWARGKRAAAAALRHHSQPCIFMLHLYAIITTLRSAAAAAAAAAASSSKQQQQQQQQTMDSIAECVCTTVTNSTPDEIKTEILYVSHAMTSLHTQKKGG